jgi:flavin reductase (DIM6/NTAB) family NADH-FMN oxidoreductase RutF
MLWSDYLGGIDMDEKTVQALGAALGRIPSGLFILTSAHEENRGGMLASWVQQVCFQPPMVSVAVGKGRPIMPLISASRQFGLCQIPRGDKMLMRKFLTAPEPGVDPFLGHELVEPTRTGVPILAHCLGYLECELVCHMDVEGDHDLFVGQVRGGAYFAGEPHVHIRENGLKY